MRGILLSLLFALCCQCTTPDDDEKPSGLPLRKIDLLGSLRVQSSDIVDSGEALSIAKAQRVTGELPPLSSDPLLRPEIESLSSNASGLASGGLPFALRFPPSGEGAQSSALLYTIDGVRDFFQLPLDATLGEAEIPATFASEVSGPLRMRFYLGTPAGERGPGRDHVVKVKATEAAELHVTLSWDQDIDLDLLVIDPVGSALPTTVPGDATLRSEQVAVESARPGSHYLHIITPKSDESLDTNAFVTLRLRGAIVTFQVLLHADEFDADITIASYVAR